MKRKSTSIAGVEEASFGMRLYQPLISFDILIESNHRLISLDIERNQRLIRTDKHLPQQVLPS
jgi:hypothetical protein